MNVKDLRTLVDNLEEYIHVPGGIERLKKTILHLAVSGHLVQQDPSEGTGEELYKQIQEEKAKLISDGKLKKQKPLHEISEDEVPFDIPESWRWVRLGKISKTISKGTTPSGGKLAYANSGIRFVRAENVGKDGNVSLKDARYITQQMNDGPLSRSILEPYDLLISIAGTLGRSSIVAPEQLPLNTNQAVSFTRLLNTQLLYPWFFQKAVASPQLQKLLVSSVKTTAIPNLTLEIISNCIVPLPPESEQRRIVKKIGSVFALIDTLTIEYKDEQLERRKLVVASLGKFAKGEGNLALDQLTEIIKTKEDAMELRKTILHLAVSSQLVPQDPLEGTGEELYEQIQAEKARLITEGKLKKQKPLPEISEENNPFEIPKSWKWARLGSVSIYQQRGKSPKYTTISEYPVISQRCVRTSYIDWQVVKYITTESVEKYESFRFLRNGDLLLNSTGTGTMGRVGMFRSNLKFDKVVADSHVTVVRMLDTVQSDFMHIFLNAPFVQNNVESKASGSTNQIEWNLSSIQEEIIAFPPLEEQKRIVKRTNELLSLVSELESKVEK